MSAFNKADLINAVADASGLTLDETRKAIDAFTGVVRSQAEAGNAVKIVGFGKFEMRTRASRVGRNPSTGAEIQIPESRSLSFKASKPK